jgi:hypothetical protein
VPDRVVAHVGDGGVEDQHFRLFRHVRVDRVNVQVAESTPRNALLLRADRLVAEEQHLMLSSACSMASRCSRFSGWLMSTPLICAPRAEG